MPEAITYPKNFIRYLGTGGARFSMVKQARQTGGIWFDYGGLKGVVDPGPGSLFHICGAYPVLDPHDLRVILLTHRHLDHSTDINVLAEAMTGGGFERQGTIVIPSDAVHGEDPVLLRYTQQKVENVHTPKDAEEIGLACGVTVEPVAHVHHSVDCFGWIFRKKGLPSWGVISDTKPLDCLADRYKDCSFISINATFPDKKPRLDHMSIADTGELLCKLRPKLAAITHMGLLLIDSGPERYADLIATDDTRVVAARDGMIVNIDTLDVMTPVLKPREVPLYESI